ncbi:AAA family ATPase [Saccharopolyspora sp. CA-218241]|uniref:MinD/ParA family ATP-binding protein n=1 Tax=Saccharopolyspora sp. CA-218241 TaxID=3240027 RepID=UPI003D96437E
MTGRYEEPEAQRQASGADGAAQQQGPYTEPETRPAAPNPLAEHPAPSYVDPDQPPAFPPEAYQGDAARYPGGAPAQQQFPPGYYEATPSGPQQAAASGPHQVPGAQSGPHPVSGGPSGPYPQAGQSGPYPVQGGPSGPYPVQGGPSGPYPVPGGQPYPGQQGQQFQQGGQHQFGPYGQGAPSGPAADQPFGQDLSSSQLLKQTKRPPQSGWRKALYVASGKTVNLGESPADLRRRQLIARINQPLQGCYKIAMLSLKGGVGKTTTTTTLGSTFSSLRGDRVIAVDANPDRGTLSQKIPLETTATVRHLLRDAHRITKYSDVRSYTSQGPSRLEILASEQDPAVSEAFSEDDYRRTVTLLEHFYNVVLTDCGTGLMHSAMKGVLDEADSLVIVSSSSIDGARSASATLDWLDAHGYGELVSRSVAVINSARPTAGKVDVDKLAAHFASRCRAVSKIPFDPHLEEGAEVELDQLAAPTRLALLELAAIVADDFPHALGRKRQS